MQCKFKLNTQIIFFLAWKVFIFFYFAVIIVDKWQWMTVNENFLACKAVKYTNLLESGKKTRLEQLKTEVGYLVQILWGWKSLVQSLKYSSFPFLRSFTVRLHSSCWKVEHFRDRSTNNLTFALKLTKYLHIASLMGLLI